MTTLRDAINEAMDVHGTDALWSDGAESWQLGNYLDAQDAEPEGEEYLARPAYFTGRAIMPVDGEGMIGGMAILTRQAR